MPVCTWNLAGYRSGRAPAGSGNGRAFGGLTGAAFRRVSPIGGGRDAGWRDRTGPGPGSHGPGPVLSFGQTFSWFCEFEYGLS